MNLSVSVIVKLIFLSCTLDGPSLHASLCNTEHWQLGSTGSWYEAALPNVATPHETLSKITLLDIISNHIREVFTYWKALHLVGAHANFPTSNYHLKA